MNTRRRWLAAGLGLPALGWVDTLRAQAPAPVVIGWLSPAQATAARGGRTFSESMAALGWKEGAQYVVEERSAQGQLERLPALAQEIAAAKPAVIVVITSAAARAAMAAAPATPIVMAIGEPLSSGLVNNLARPGGMVTGLSNVSADLDLKCIELLLESVPKLKRVGFLIEPSFGARVNRLRSVAEQLRFEAVFADVARPQDVEPAFGRLVKDKAQALVLLAPVWLGQFHPQIIGLALAQRWPVVGTQSAIARQGGLFIYGPDSMALIRRSATYVDRILKGAKPGDLPIEQPTTFELALNLKTAKQLGITFPRSVMARATELIE
jgi:putative ABC transport system substrate-binding protein